MKTQDISRMLDNAKLGWDMIASDALCTAGNGRAALERSPAEIVQANEERVLSVTQQCCL